MKKEKSPLEHQHTFFRRIGICIGTIGMALVTFFVWLERRLQKEKKNITSNKEEKE